MGNLLTTSMSKECDPESDTELDPSILFEPTMQTDSVDSSSYRQLKVNLNPSQIRHIQNNLDVYEKVSLIYLLRNEAEDALKDMDLIVSGNMNNFLQSWMQINEKNWQNKLIEALCIIQNYQVLKVLVMTFTKDELKKHFLPLQKFSSIYVDKAKKFIYRMFEEFDSENESQFLQSVKTDFEEKNIFFPTYNYLEMYFVYFETINYINQNDYTNVTKHLKLMDKDFLCDGLKRFTKCKENKSPQKKTCIEENSLITDEINEIVNEYEAGPSDRIYEALNYDKAQGTSVQSNIIANNKVANVNDVESAYYMDPEYPGICLIIENENFYTEFEERQHMTIKSNNIIEARKGTNKDSEALRNTFNRYGFHVIHVKDKTDIEMKKIIKETAFEQVEQKHSSLFLCILTHGIEGQVIASNSIPVDIKEIKQLICSPQLESKPKVLILQSCQGERLQKIFSNDDITTDGISTEKPPNKVASACDILEVWSTIPGYASIRSTSTGSWFIQSLCKILNSNVDNKHFLDICIMVQDDISKQHWQKGKEGIYVMVPQLSLTLRKKLYLPLLK